MKGYEIGSNEAVIKMGSLHIEGNVLPLSWFKHLKLENGKPDAIAAVLLADIVYWYRPIEVRDEFSGELIGYRKKFAADKLQRSYDRFGEVFGFTKDQVRDALKRLETNGLIDLDFRHIVVNTVLVGNVLFIGLNVDRLAEITTTHAMRVPLSDSNPIGYVDEIRDPIDFKSHTNTEITPETSTESRGGGRKLFSKKSKRNSGDDRAKYVRGEYAEFVEH